MHINEMAKQIHDLAKEKGWHDDNESIDHFIERTCNNIHNEVSELHEAWRNNKLFERCDKAKIMQIAGVMQLTNIEEELADIIIRALDACIKLDLNPEHIIISKHSCNKLRGYRHGGKRS